MSCAWAVYKRELLAFAVTPLLWVLLVVFLTLQGLHFSLLIDHFAAMDPGAMADATPLSAFFGSTVLPFLVLFLLVPAMSMRLLSEERRSGTIELLVTTPLSSLGLVLAKYLAALTVYVTLWAPTLLYVAILRRSGEVDLGVAASSYVGVLLLGAGYLAIGLLMSATTRSQFVALLLTALVILGLFIVGLGEYFLRPGTAIYAVCTHVSPWAMLGDHASGIVEARRLVWSATLIVVPLFLAKRVVDAWRWG